MKKKLAMRVASLAMCVVFTGILFGAPKSKAVAVEAAAVSIGAAVLGSYLIATNMDLIGDTAETISNGITSLANDFCESISYPGSGEDWLSALGTAAQMRNPGVLIVPGALAAGCAAFVAWLTETFALNAEGDSAVAVAGSSNSNRLLYNGVSLPDISSVWDQSYRFAIIVYQPNVNPGTYVLATSRSVPCTRTGSLSSSGSLGFGFNRSVNYSVYYCEPADSSWSVFYTNSNAPSYGWLDSYATLVWSNHDVLDENEAIFLLGRDAVVPGELGVARGVGFTNIADQAQDDEKLAISTGLEDALTLEDFATMVPAQIATGQLTSTAELTQTGEGAGEGEGTDDDVIGGDSTTVGLLQSILNGVNSIPESISTSIADVFTPSQEAVDNLASEVDTKLPFIPVLKDFGADLVYNLEHPEDCADGIGLTTVVDLGKGRGTYLGDTTLDLLDVSWYLEYKPLVDDIIVGFCWLVFLWNLYGALPRIIHGEGSTITVNAMDFPTVNEGSLTQKSLGPSDGKIWGEGGNWKMW